MHKIKITVARKVCHQDLIDRYENPMENPCDMAEGQTFISDGWMKNPKSVLISCNDGFRPVSFLIEVLN